MENNLSEEEQNIIKEFKELQSFTVDEYKLQQKLQSSQDILKRFLNVENQVRIQSIFSPNESIKEVQEEFLDLLFLPYYIALCTQKMTENRKKYLQESIKYLDIFLQLMGHYEVSVEKVNKILEEYNQKDNYQIDRDKKIDLYKQEKILQDELEKFKNNDYRKNHKIRSQILCIKAINKIVLISQEIKILEFKEKLDNDPEAKAEYEKQKQEYKPPQIKFFKMDKPKKQASELVQQYLFERGIEVPDDMKPDPINLQMQPNIGQTVVKNYTIPKTIINQKGDMAKKMWQHSYPLPTMTIEEHDDLEYALMKDKQNKQKEFAQSKQQQLKKMGIEDEDDSDNEIVSDMKTYKARNWDNFKDENEKGGGNRNHR